MEGGDLQDKNADKVRVGRTRRGHVSKIPNLENTKGPAAVIKENRGGRQMPGLPTLPLHCPLPMGSRKTLGTKSFCASSTN